MVNSVCVLLCFLCLSWPSRGALGSAMSAPGVGVGFGIDAVLEAVGSSGDVDDIGVVEESVEDGGGGRDVADEFAPLLDWAVGGHEGGPVFVTAHDDLEEVLAGTGWEEFDAHVIENEKVGFDVAREGA